MRQHDWPPMFGHVCRTEWRATLGRDAGIAPTAAQEMRKPHGPALWGGLGNTFGHWNMAPREVLDKIALLTTPQGSEFDQKDII